MFNQNRHFLTPQKRPAAVQCLLRMAADQRCDIPVYLSGRGRDVESVLSVAGGRDAGTDERAGAVSLRSAQRTGPPPPPPPHYVLHHKAA